MSAILDRQKISRRPVQSLGKPVSIVRRTRKGIALRRGRTPVPTSVIAWQKPAARPKWTGPAGKDAPAMPSIKPVSMKFVAAPAAAVPAAAAPARREKQRVKHPAFGHSLAGAGTLIMGHPKESALIAAAFICLICGGLFTGNFASSRKYLGILTDNPLPMETEVNSLLLSIFDSEPGTAELDEASVPSSLLVASRPPVQYTVKAGDTLSGIAQRYNVDVGTLISFNSIKDVKKIKAGTQLTIPPMNGILYTVRTGDSISRIAALKGVGVNDILDANNLESEVIRPGEQLFIPGARISKYEYDLATGQLFLYPVAGRLTSGFGYRNDPFTGKRRFHYGIDLANALGTRVAAARDGEVVAIGSNNAYGNYIVIKHDNGFQSLYAHLDSVHVRKGQWVSQGNWIGNLGNTGRSTGPHLHFSIYKNNNAIDPLQYLH